MGWKPIRAIGGRVARCRVTPERRESLPVEDQLAPIKNRF
jgi:hypothetical protein